MEETFSAYFDGEQSMSSTAPTLLNALKIIAERYIGENPAQHFRFRAYRSDGFLPDAEGRYSFDLNERFPEAEMGQYSLIAAVINEKTAETLTVKLSCFSKTELYLNGEKVWSSSTMDELDAEKVIPVALHCTKGRNDLVLLCKKTGTGFGCRLSAAEPFWRWIPFYAPFSGRSGQGGFVCSYPFALGEAAAETIDFSAAEEASGIKWSPDSEKGAVSDPYALEEVFGHADGKWACMWTRLVQRYPGKKTVHLELSGAECFIDGEAVSTAAELSSGEHDVLIVSQCPAGREWEIGFAARYDCGTPEMKNPGICGCTGEYIYLGLLSEKPEFTRPELHRLYGENEKCYWRVNRYTAVRPYLEESCFGKFSYPLGVTLYGLTQTGRILGRADIIEYVKSHIRECVSMHEYSLWDRETFGYPEINNQIVTLGCLDSCGSFGSAMMEAFKDGMDQSVRKTADIIADYMEHGQARLDDGAFYRPKGVHPTMWADDQYMSIPFLCRYARAAGDTACIEDAVRQVLLFRKHLYIPEKKVMSHVLDFTIGKPTMIPWGRGNGWTLFSISELLEYLPEDHENRAELLEYFKELCEGYLALQGSRGLWHQVLTMPDTYEEASCTAMFIYSFCRAVRFGWVGEELAERLFAAAVKGWDGLQSHAIDKFGNIYGICKGSLYSYDSDYYKNILGWSKNDTHGTGIVLLAGIELSKLM